MLLLGRGGDPGGKAPAAAKAPAKATETPGNERKDFMPWNRTTRTLIEARIKNAKDGLARAVIPLQIERAELYVRAAETWLRGWDMAQDIAETDSETIKAKKLYITEGNLSRAAEKALEIMPGYAENKASAANRIEKAITEERCGIDDIDNAAAIMRDERNAHEMIWLYAPGGKGWA